MSRPHDVTTISYCARSLWHALELSKDIGEHEELVIDGHVSDIITRLLSRPVYSVAWLELVWYRLSPYSNLRRSDLESCSGCTGRLLYHVATTIKYAEWVLRLNPNKIRHLVRKSGLPSFSGFLCTGIGALTLYVVLRQYRVLIIVVGTFGYHIGPPPVRYCDRTTDRSTVTATVTPWNVSIDYLWGITLVLHI